jgi:DNA-binding IscR family transcriptional regulator
VSSNSRFTVALHILSWMALVAQRGIDVATSDRIAVSVNTNPVVVRRALGRLRRAGLVRAQRGHGAGWSLVRPVESVSLLDVYQAIAPDAVFGLHPSVPNQGCPIGRGIQPALRRVYGGVEQAMRSELTRTTVADILAETLAARPAGPVRPSRRSRTSK